MYISNTKQQKKYTVIQMSILHINNILKFKYSLNLFKNIFIQLIIPTIL